MMMLEVKPPKLSIGGLSCKSCKFWIKYLSEQRKDLGLVGDSWGKCTNNSVNLQARLGGIGLNNSSNVNIQKMGGITVVSTSSSYSCPNYQERLEN